MSTIDGTTTTSPTCAMRTVLSMANTLLKTRLAVLFLIQLQCLAKGTREADMPTAAFKFALKGKAVSTVIAGIRNPHQAQMNCAAGAMPATSDELGHDLRKHHWHRSFWPAGK